MADESAHFPLLALPDHCMLAVLQCCAADDQRSVLSAARAHSRLHQAAVAALCSISIALARQQQADSVLLYLDRHGSHVSSLSLRKLWAQTLRQLPSSLQLHSLELVWWKLQLVPGTGFQGVLRAAAAGPPLLKQLRLSACDLLDGVEGLEAALLQLPALQHLSLCKLFDVVSAAWVCFPTGVLQQLPQLTYLQLAGCSVQGPDEASPALQPLQALTQLSELRLADAEVAATIVGDGDWARVTASMLSAAGHLTRLALACAVFEPIALAHMTKLQHLQLAECGLRWPAGAAAGLAALLSQLQQQTQLTHLDVSRSTVRAGEEGYPPTAAYAALTASSKLQHLNISGSRLPAGVWQHLFPAGRQLLHLTSLDISAVDLTLSAEDATLALEGSRIVGCCPSLQSLDMRYLQYDAQQVVALQGLSLLHTLHVVVGTWEMPPGRLPDHLRDILQAVCQLTGLRDLELLVHHHPTDLLLTHLQQLQQLQQLTALTYSNQDPPELLQQAGPDDEPVWRQLLHLYLDDSNPDVAQQAAAALEQ